MSTATLTPGVDEQQDEAADQTEWQRALICYPDTIEVDVPALLTGPLRRDIASELAQRADDITIADSCDPDYQAIAFAWRFGELLGSMLKQIGWPHTEGDSPADEALRAHRGALLYVITQHVHLRDEDVKHALEEFNVGDCADDVRDAFRDVEAWLNFYEAVVAAEEVMA